MCMNPQNYVTNLWRFLTLIHLNSDTKRKKIKENPTTDNLKSL